MFEAFSYLFLQQYWWIIISVLASLLVFLMFVQGGQTLFYTMGKDDDERTMLINVLGRKWETTFTTLVTFGGAFFASFPLFYATSFGGAYWLWMLILFSFIIQAISYEYRSKPSNFLGKRTYETFLFINGSFGPFLLGVAVGTFFTGSPFVVNEMNSSAWQTSLHGLEALVKLPNLLLGISVLLLTRVLGIQYFIRHIDAPDIEQRSRKHMLYNAIPFALVFVAFTGWLLMKEGYAYNPANGEVTMEPHKYLHNLVEMPLVGFLFVAGVASVLFGIYVTVFREKNANGIWYTAPGTVLTVFSLFLIAGFNNTAYYPSSYDLQSSLTIQNSSSSQYTLTIMSYVSLLVPFVGAYITYAWRAINKKKIDKDEIQGDGHKY